MSDDLEPIVCPDDTEQITINVPCRLMQRVQKYALENNDTVAGVVIEALDYYMRRPKTG